MTTFNFDKSKRRNVSLYAVSSRSSVLIQCYLISIEEIQCYLIATSLHPLPVQQQRGRMNSVFTAAANGYSKAEDGGPARPSPAPGGSGRAGPDHLSVNKILCIVCRSWGRWSRSHSLGQTIHLRCPYRESRYGVGLRGGPRNPAAGGTGAVSPLG